jgi:beta-lactamase superfamily II metal-dependent hydrolase
LRPGTEDQSLGSEDVGLAISIPMNRSRHAKMTMLALSLMQNLHAISFSVRVLSGLTVRCLSKALDNGRRRVAFIDVGETVSIGSRRTHHSSFCISAQSSR